MMIQFKNTIRFAIAISLLLIVSSFRSPMHRFYLSLTEVHLDTGKHTLNVSCKMFTDDVETALSRISRKKVSIGSKGSKEQTALLNKMLEAYLADNFKINIGGKLLKLKYLGYEIENDGIWCYLEVSSFKGKGNVAVYDSLLYEDFPDQSNLVNFYRDKESKSAKLSNPDKMAMFEF